MNFTNVFELVAKASCQNYGLKTVVRKYDLSRDTEQVRNQFISKLQEFNALSIDGERGNIPAAGAFTGYLVSLYSVLAKVSPASAISTFNAFWQRAEEILIVKAKEYAKEGDRFYNFKRALEITRQLEGHSTSTVQCALGMAMKHVVSCEDCILSLVPELKTGRKPEEQQKIIALLNEKFGDLVNYIVLLEGILLENE